MASAAEQPADKAGSGGISAMWRGARRPPADPETSFKGKTILITGATSGVGYEAAIKFGKLGASRLVLGVRDPSAAAATRQSITQASGLPASAITLLPLDCSSFASAAAFAAAVQRDVGALDVALLNAGVACPAYAASRDGWESGLQVNVLATALLAVRLLPVLTRPGAPARACIEITGSEAYLDVQEAWLPGAGESLLEAYNRAEAYSAERQYRVTKLLVMFVQDGLVAALRDVPGAPDVVVSSPGMCRTRLGREFGYALRAVMAGLHAVVARSAEEGSRSLVSGAALGREGNGMFWRDDELNGRVPLLRPDVWHSRSPFEFANMLDVLEKACPGTKAMLGA